MMLNTRPIGLVFKQHPRDPANVNACKNMCDPYSGLSILLHGVISLPDATSYDKKRYTMYTMQNEFSNCFVWVSPSTSNLEFRLYGMKIQAPIIRQGFPFKKLQDFQKKWPS